MIRAYLDDYRLLRMIVSVSYYNGETGGFYVSDGSRILSCTVLERFALPEEVYYTLRTEEDLVPGHVYTVTDGHGHRTLLQARWITRSKRFEEEYRFEGLLGALYTKEKTVFRLWAPTRTEAVLILKEGDHKEAFVMKRGLRGTFEITVEKDCSDALYRYQLTEGDCSVTCTDPYGLSSTANGEWSAVIDLSRFEPVSNTLRRMEDVIIYETNVRDLTSRIGAGTYCAAAKKDLSRFGYKDPIDYIKELGVTYVQLQPVLDFATIDETNPEKHANWGYDTTQFFAPEGSYSSDPDDPYVRMNELRELVGAFHKCGLGVVFDVVYNHVYDVDRSVLEACVPYYYFQYAGGERTGGSGCGCDFDSRRFMSRHLLSASVRHLMQFYQADGLRFDLMGVLDHETMVQLYGEAVKIRPDVLFYGEGWVLPVSYEPEEKADITQAHRMPHIGMFNPELRDCAKEYLCNDLSRASAFAESLLGKNWIDDPQRRINAVETHDDETVWDWLLIRCGEESEVQRTDRQKMMIAAAIFSAGLPFLHAGQEFCGTKNGMDNSYEAGDDINGMDWERMSAYREIVAYTKKCIRLRREIPWLRLCTQSEIDRRIISHTDDSGRVWMECGKECVIWNPSKEAAALPFREPVQVIFDENGDCRGKSDERLIQPARSVWVIRREKEDAVC